MAVSTPKIRKGIQSAWNDVIATLELAIHEGDANSVKERLANAVAIHYDRKNERAREALLLVCRVAVNEYLKDTFEVKCNYNSKANRFEVAETIDHKVDTDEEKIQNAFRCAKYFGARARIFDKCGNGADYLYGEINKEYRGSELYKETMGIGYWEHQVNNLEEGS